MGHGLQGSQLEGEALATAALLLFVSPSKLPGPRHSLTSILTPA